MKSQDFDIFWNLLFEQFYLSLNLDLDDLIK